jgi:hypothetical protein
MRKLRRLWMPVLLGALLMATVVGVTGARPDARPEPSPQLQNHMIDAHHCIPVGDTDPDFHLTALECNTGDCFFMCPIKPPHEGLISVRRLAFYAYDNNDGEVCISLWHTYPKTASIERRLAPQCTTNSAADPQEISYNLANFKVSQLQDLFVALTVNYNGQRFYGAKLRYEPL